jgi:hypothetical protein
MIKINNQGLLIKKRILVNFNKEKSLFKKEDKVYKIDKILNLKKR